MNFNATSGEVWYYEYDMSGRMTRSSSSKKGTGGLTERASYAYDYRGLLGSDNKPRANASEKYGFWYRRWDFNAFNGLDVKHIDEDKMSPRMKHEMQNK